MCASLIKTAEIRLTLTQLLIPQRFTLSAPSECFHVSIQTCCVSDAGGRVMAGTCKGDCSVLIFHSNNGVSNLTISVSPCSLNGAWHLPDYPGPILLYGQVFMQSVYNFASWKNCGTDDDLYWEENTFAFTHTHATLHFVHWHAMRHDE